MTNKPDLTPDFCLHVVVNSTPSPSRFRFGTDDPSVVTLFDMGITDSTKAGGFVQAVKSRIFPWHIDDVKVAGSRDTTLQTAAASIPKGAF
jgi:hypothetical protein